MSYRGWTKPSLLLCVRNNGGFRGRELAENLIESSFGDVKPKRVYQMLRGMEKDGLVSTKDSFVDRPAWRRYEITASGERYLERWVGSLEKYHTQVGRFLQLYDEHFARRKSRRA